MDSGMFLAGKLDRGGGAERAESLDVQGAIQRGDPPEEGTVAHRGVDPRQAVPGAIDGEVARAGLAPAVVPAGKTPGLSESSRTRIMAEYPPCEFFTSTWPAGIYGIQASWTV